MDSIGRLVIRFFRRAAADADVAGRRSFADIAGQVGELLDGAWIVGHNVAFDVGFLAIELALVGFRPVPLGCLDTCKLAAAQWDFPNHQLGTVAAQLGIKPQHRHRAIDDAEVSHAILNRVVAEAGGWHAVTVEDLVAMHTYSSSWPEDPLRRLPAALYDALANGRETDIRYVNGEGLETLRSIRPLACFAVGRATYVRAFCGRAGELRTFRVNRIISRSLLRNGCASPARTGSDHLQPSTDTPAKDPGRSGLRRPEHEPDRCPGR